jgi:aminoglycoside phosphotransferase (APT) family kinase protein
MELAGSLTLGWQVAAAAGLVATDRIGGALGRALPATPEAIADPRVLDEILRAGAPDGRAPLPRVARVRLPGVDFESSNCRNFLVELAFEGEPRSDLPATAYVKLPSRSLAARVFANALGFWALECTFSRTLAHRVPVRVPRVYAVARRGSRFVLVLEDMTVAPGVRLFVNRDMAAGTTPERAARMVETLAELHAAFWGWSAAQREAVLPLALHTFLAPRRRAASRALNAAAIGPCLSHARDVFTPQLAALCRRAIARWDRMLEAWYGEGPLTLVHGDSHLGNHMEIAGPEGPRMGLLDFQAVHWSKGIRDVQYCLINSLAPDVLARHESSLIDHYVAELARRGVALDPDRAREEYRAFSFQTLMTAVVSLGLGGLIEREAVVRTVLERSAAAVERLGFADWLDRLPA